MSFTVLAHDKVIQDVIGSSLTEIVRTNQIKFTLIAALLIFILTAIAIILSKITKNPQESTQITQDSNVSQQPSPEIWKTILFIGMVLIILTNTAYLVGSTLYVNLKSITGGPVHWHADFEVWDCGVKLDLIDPKPPSNKVGSALLHEHGDSRIHVEEAVFDKNDVNLGAFFRVAGGDLHSDYMKFPTSNGVVERRNNDLCPDGSLALLQVFAYKAGSFTPEKLVDPENYVITSDSKVPPGDCLIIEFGPPKAQTDKLCKSYEVAKEKENGRN